MPSCAACDSITICFPGALQYLIGSFNLAKQLHQCSPSEREKSYHKSLSSCSSRRTPSIMAGPSITEQAAQAIQAAAQAVGPPPSWLDHQLQNKLLKPYKLLLKP
ncbi:hypothetical protein OIU85_010339 [Salix viminalis]|uniref:Uncharacterized protein n=1 Tax=Salix viminalis TaxID=40686 RepID=A0A9Q0NWF2_SALVM|nr:hypothetical protein OIU85_010339 [Salix viminalis]